jgi:preprotein translocase subunit SecF
MIDWLGYRKIYFSLSAAMLVISFFSLVVWGLKLGVDFTGGSLIEVEFATVLEAGELEAKLNRKDIGFLSLQPLDEKTYVLRFSPLDEVGKEQALTAISESTGVEFTQKRFETVGPSVGPELVKKTFYAVAIAAGAILLWVAYQFKNLKYGASAILAMFHDTFILIGSFSLLGRYLGVETDFLFVTALLTTLSFSVHDTIVVYDRIRETQKKEGGAIYNLANRAVTETMVRSLNNSFTILFMLIALVLLGGSTIKWFAVALMTGTVLGTYSSPFVAVPLLVNWEKFSGKLRKPKNYKAIAGILKK